MTATCAWCQQPISGRYRTWSDGTACCEACFRDVPACGACKRPVTDPVEAAGRAWCRACLAQVEACGGCGTPLVDKKLVHPSLPDTPFCPTCAKSLTICDFCGAPIVSGGHRHGDGRDACATCHGAALDPAELPALADAARAWLADRLGFTLRPASECPVHLVDAHQIAAVQGKAFSATPGFDGRERGLFAAETRTARQGGKIVAQEHTLAIYVESGLPRPEAYGTLVHELVHLWQFDVFPKKPIHRQYVEGLAVWAQAHALDEAGHPGAARRARENPHPAYGGGYKLIAEIERAHGFAATPERLVLRVGGRWTR